MFFIAVTILLRIKYPIVTVENLKVGKLFGTKNCRDVQILSWKLFKININLFVLKNLPKIFMIQPSRREYRAIPTTLKL